MKKLVSLAERPATNEDIGKVVYELESVYFDDEKDIKFWNETYPETTYWQKPVMVSEEYLKELEVNQVKGGCKECKWLYTPECRMYEVQVAQAYKEIGSQYCSEFEPKDKGEL